MFVIAGKYFLLKLKNILSVNHKESVSFYCFIAHSEEGEGSSIATPGMEVT